MNLPGEIIEKTMQESKEILKKLDYEIQPYFTIK